MPCCALDMPLHSRDKNEAFRRWGGVRQHVLLVTSLCSEVTARRGTDEMPPPAVSHVSSGVVDTSRAQYVIWAKNKVYEVVLRLCVAWPESPR